MRSHAQKDDTYDKMKTHRAKFYKGKQLRKKSESEFIISLHYSMKIFLKFNAIEIFKINLKHKEINFFVFEINFSMAIKNPC